MILDPRVNQHYAYMKMAILALHSKTNVAQIIIAICYHMSTKINIEFGMYCLKFCFVLFLGLIFYFEHNLEIT